MNPKPLFRSAALFASLCVILACSAVRAPAFGAKATPTQSGIPVVAAPIQFAIPEGLATAASVETIAAVTDQSGAPWDIAPAHVQVTLQGYAVQTSFQVPQIFVYPAQPYAAVNASAAESLKRLRTILSNPTATYGNDALPYVPFFNAGQVFAAQQKVVKFQGGSSLRVVTKYAQDVSPIDNGTLIYHFQGLTSDGNYYIVAVLPVTSPLLAADNNPDSPVPTGGIPFPQNTAPTSDFESYFTKITDLLNGSSSDQFTPSLNLLDELTQSITVNP